MKRRFGSIRANRNRFTVAYTGPDGGRHTPGKSFATEQQAELWLAQEESLIEQHHLGYTTWTPPAARNQQAQQDTTTVGQWLEQYHTNLEHRPKPPRPSTMQNYRRVTTNRILEPIAPGDGLEDITRLSSLPLVKLTKADVYRWWDGVQRAYPNAHTINQQAFKRLRAACEEATRREMIPTNPVDVPEAGKRVQTKEKYLPEDGELQAILEAMPVQYRVLTSLMLFHGLRIGEALALEQRHVQVEYLPAPWMPRVVVTVEQNAQRLGGEDGRTFMYIQPPKSDAGYREVPIIASHVPLFLEHHALHLPGATTPVETWQGPRRVSLLTATRTGGLMMDTSYRSVLNRAKERAGVSMEIDPHCGRNWLITRLAEQGAHLKEIGKLLGQDDVATILDVYMKVRAGRTATLMEKVNATVMPGNTLNNRQGE